MKNYKDYIIMNVCDNFTKFNYLSVYSVINDSWTNYTKLSQKEKVIVYIIPKRSIIPKKFNKIEKRCGKIIIGSNICDFHIEAKNITIYSNNLNEFVFVLDKIKSIQKKSYKSGFMTTEYIDINGNIIKSYTIKCN